VDRGDWERVAAIYMPLAIALLARLLRGKRPRQFAACLLIMLWVLPALLALQRLNAVAHWWSFSDSAASLRGMPLELLLGWSFLWELVPQLIFPDLNVVVSATVMAAIDCLLMPLFTASLHLQPRWLVGEAVAIGLVLLPGLCLAQWTLYNSHLRARAVLQVITAAMLFLFFLPEVCFSIRPGAGWTPLLELPSWARQLGIQTILLMAIPGVGAVMEFAERGQGTPIPYDPPLRLVTSGIYRYIANPMQVSCAVVMLAWAGMLRNGWLSLSALLSVAYSAGIANWDEKGDLQQRFGKEWLDYRSAVRNWSPRWRPYHAGPAAVLYVARSCEPCSQIGAWLEVREPLGLKIVAAESLPAGSIQRMRYEANDGTPHTEGVRAMGRALEHLSLSWAIAGAVLRIPGIWQLVQLLMDASGLGPRLIGDAHCETR
jgi:protein-S-isoprenylcysteine O-methyltransferase Ste14